MRVFDRDLIRGGHYGQRSCEPHLQAEHMAAPTNAANVKKVLANPLMFALAGKADVGLDRVEVWNDPKRQGHLGSSYSAKARQDVQSDCYGLYNWVDNRRFPASDEVWLSSASELRIRAVPRAKALISHCASAFRTPPI